MHTEPVLCGCKAWKCWSHTSWRALTPQPLQRTWGDRKRWPSEKMPRWCEGVGKRWLISPGKTGILGWLAWKRDLWFKWNQKLLPHSRKLCQLGTFQENFFWLVHSSQLEGRAEPESKPELLVPEQASKVYFCHDPGKQDLFKELPCCVK